MAIKCRISVEISFNFYSNESTFFIFFMHFKHFKSILREMENMTNKKRTGKLNVESISRNLWPYERNFSCKN